MYNLDFLSESPKIFIFQNVKNKTNFGGILFLIYIAVMIFISLLYLADYSMNEKYSYEALTIYNRTNVSYDESFAKDKELNPILNISIEFFDSDKFALLEYSSGNLLEDLPKYEFSKQFSENDIIIYYKCGQDSKCTSFEEYYNNSGYLANYGQVNITYHGYKINHTHEPPVYEDDSGNLNSKILSLKNGEGKGIKIGYKNRTYEWEVIKYRDQKSLFDSVTKRKTEFTFGKIKDNFFNYTEYDNYVNEVFLKRSYSKDEYFYYLPIEGFYFNNPNNDYFLYKRTKISFLDVIAKIGALFSTIKFFFAFAFSFYSKNFNNYTIVNNIFNPHKKLIKSINYSSDNNISINDLDNDSPLIDEKSQENKENKNVENINDNVNYNEKQYSNENNSDASSFALNKLSFYDFFFNNIYSKCCKRMRNQEIINMTNKIVYKYLSIDSMLINQMKIENLFKDYKWNNPLLNNVQNNKMIDELKNI